MLTEQYAILTAQIPLMYALLFVDAVFLGLATYGLVPQIYSVGIPAALFLVMAVRAGIWVARRGQAVTLRQIRRYLVGSLIGASVISACFGGWGLVLMGQADPTRGTAIALYVFVAAMSACYCLQALPLAGWLVILFGAAPVTAALVTSGDLYLTGIGVTFILTAAVLLRILGNSFAGLQELLRSRAEMAALITALQDSEAHYRHSVDLSPQIPWIADPSGLVTELGPRWAAVTGLDLSQSLGTGWSMAVHPEDLPRVQDLWERALAIGGEEVADTRYRLRQKDGTYRWYRARGFPRTDGSGAIVAWYGSLEDIEEQVMAERALQDSEERYRLASQASSDIILEVSLVRDRIDWGGAAATIFGYDVIANGSSRRWWIERVHPADRAAMLADFKRLDNAEIVHGSQEFRFRAADRSYLNLIARGHVVRGADGSPLRLIGTLQDVTARKRYEEGLLWAAHYDSLTRLPNRVLFAQRLEEALQAARQSGRHVGLVVLDVDRFKTVNDSLGHDAGDVLLCEIARRLTARAPASATVARLGGDEFAIILPDLPDIATRARIVERVLAQVAGPMFHDGRQIEVSLSAGSAAAFADGLTSEDLHKSADLALYAAKSEGSGQVSYFRHDLRDAAARRTQMLQNARQALHGNRIVPFYQPKVCLRTGACVGFEALLRWHDGHGLQRPAGISAAFDDPGLSAQLTERMLDRVIADMVRWHDNGVAFHSIAINGSAGDFMRGDFAERILERLIKAGLPPSVIELEVTETVFLGQLAETVSAALTTLSAHGVAIALDDFGTGYASLTHLKQFPVDSLKIDRSFVSMLGAAETEDDAIVGAVIDLAGNLAIRTVAEGIETTAQLAHLVVKGCDVGQGYLFGRPMAGGHVAEVIAAWDKEAVCALWASADWETELRKVHQGHLPLAR